MCLAGCQIILIDLNFHLQKYLEIFDKNSADKIQFKNYKEVNLPCLMPIRVKQVDADTAPTVKLRVLTRVYSMDINFFQKKNKR